MSAGIKPKNVSTKQSFLNDDFYDALRWLFVSAVTWEAMRQRSGICTVNQDAISMLASLTQARALYEFFFAVQRKGDDARACDFASKWNPNPSSLYTTYMGNGKPTNKRVSHLVYNRSAHSGGSAVNDSDHLKNQVLNLAKELRDLTQELARQADPSFSSCIRCALDMALAEARRTADHYGIVNPL